MSLEIRHDLCEVLPIIMRLCADRGRVVAFQGTTSSLIYSRMNEPRGEVFQVAYRLINDMSHLRLFCERLSADLAKKNAVFLHPSLDHFPLTESVFLFSCCQSLFLCPFYRILHRGGRFFCPVRPIVKRPEPVFSSRN